MSEFRDKVRKAARTLLNDSTNNEWDLPGRVYEIVDADEPYFRLVADIEGHPIEFFQAAHDAGVRLSDEVLGLVTLSEGYRHLDAEDLIKLGLLDMMVNRFRDASGLEVTDDEASDAFKRVYHEQIIPSLPPPSTFPDHMRHEDRFASCVLRDGSDVITAHCTRPTNEDGTPGDGCGEVQDHGDQPITGQNVPGAMYQFLHGLRPERDVDPLQLVADAKACAELAEANGLTADSLGPVPGPAAFEKDGMTFIPMGKVSDLPPEMLAALRKALDEDPSQDGAAATLREFLSGMEDDG